MNRKMRIIAIATLLVCAAGLLVLNESNTRSIGDAVQKMANDLDDWDDRTKSRRRAAAVLRTSKSFQYVKEESHFSHGVTFRFHSDPEGYLILYLPHPASGSAFVEKDGHKMQRVFASQRYGPSYGIEIEVGSKAQQRLSQLIRTSIRPDNENELRDALDAVEKRTFDWSRETR